MNHKPIQIKDLSLIYPHKTCFEAFSGDIRFGDRIALIGCNGVGKSTLLKILCGLYPASEGDINASNEVHFGYLPQVIEEFASLSGGQRINQVLTKILAEGSNVLLLDEPTNHLDKRTRHSLMRMLSHYEGTLVIASHDVELINTVTNTLWHIESGTITVFNGSYSEYQKKTQRGSSLAVCLNYNSK
jgi:ATPase subunit of ABC transporter with duplicated ATPase domains